jgi:hypothetical protein
MNFIALLLKADKICVAGNDTAHNLRGCTTRMKHLQSQRIAIAQSESQRFRNQALQCNVYMPKPGPGFENWPPLENMKCTEYLLSQQQRCC